MLPDSVHPLTMNYLFNTSLVQSCAAGAASLFDIFGVSAEPVTPASFDDDLRALEADFRAIAADFSTVMPTPESANSDP